MDLSAGDNELVTIRFIGVLVPTDKNGTQELVPTTYNYQTRSRKDPKNFVGASFHMGVGSRTDGPNCEKVFLVKTDSDGTYKNTWYTIYCPEKDNDVSQPPFAASAALRTTSTNSKSMVTPTPQTDARLTW